MTHQTIYLYEPTPVEGVEYFNERNVGLAKFLAILTGREYGGEYKLDTQTQAPGDAYWFLHGPISPEEAQKLGIEGLNFFGGITDFLYAQKSVFHNTIPDAKSIPSNFPVKFVEYLQAHDALMPGYTVFAKEDAYSAFRLLDEQGYILRVKDPIQSTMKGQYRITTEEELRGVLDTLDDELIHRYGLVLEVNMVSGSKEDLHSTSAGWYEVDDDTYYYVGFMNFEETITPFSYVGTDMFITDRNNKTILKDIQNATYAQEYLLLDVFQKANDFLDSFSATRCNYNFIRGFLETKNGHEDVERVFATEPTYRPGGATAAELLGMQFLRKSSEHKIVHARTRFHYGPINESGITEDSFIVHNGRYDGPGREGDNISTPMQVYAEIVQNDGE